MLLAACGHARHSRDQAFVDSGRHQRDRRLMLRFATFASSPSPLAAPLVFVAFAYAFISSVVYRDGTNGGTWKSLGEWWRREDSNLRHGAYDPRAALRRLPPAGWSPMIRFTG